MGTHISRIDRANPFANAVLQYRVRLIDVSPAFIYSLAPFLLLYSTIFRTSSTLVFTVAFTIPLPYRALYTPIDHFRRAGHQKQESQRILASQVFHWSSVAGEFDNDSRRKGRTQATKQARPSCDLPASTQFRFSCTRCESNDSASQCGDHQLIQ